MKSFVILEEIVKQIEKKNFSMESFVLDEDEFIRLQKIFGKVFVLKISENKDHLGRYPIVIEWNHIGNFDKENNMELLYKYGLKTYFEERNVAKAMSIFQEGAQQGYVPSQWMIGKCYENGKDYKKSFLWFESAAKLGYILAEFDLGKCYEQGKGIPQDLRQALIW
jgi:tetratricopeptide (TPR) repeat protein